MWYDQDIDKTEIMHCPVCKAFLGRRNPKGVFKGHCDECLASFVWKPGKDSPTALLDSDVRHRTCGCGRCS